MVFKWFNKDKYKKDEKLGYRISDLAADVNRLEVNLRKLTARVDVLSDEVKKIGKRRDVTKRQTLLEANVSKLFTRVSILSKQLGVHTKIENEPDNRFSIPKKTEIKGEGVSTDEVFTYSEPQVKEKDY